MPLLGLLSMVRVVVLSRVLDGAAANSASDSPASETWMGESPPLRLAARRMDVSSTEIRARVRNGRSIRGFVSDAVAAYIASTGLYLQAPAAIADPPPK